MLAISLDGLTPAALRRLRRAKAPALHRLLREGAGTLNARTQPGRRRPRFLATQPVRNGDVANLATCSGSAP